MDNNDHDPNNLDQITDKSLSGGASDDTYNDTSLDSSPSALQPDPKSPRNLVLPIAVILLLALGGLLFLKSTIKTSADNHNLERVEVVEGATLPDITLTQIDGTKVQLSSLSHKVMLINFWATWCEACMTEMPALVRMREKLQPNGFEILGINLDNNPDRAVPDVVKRLNISFPIYKDEGGTIGDLFDVHAIPLTVVIDSDRTVLFTYAGDLEWDAPKYINMAKQWLGLNPDEGALPQDDPTNVEPVTDPGVDVVE